MTDDVVPLELEPPGLVTVSWVDDYGGVHRLTGRADLLAAMSARLRREMGGDPPVPPPAVPSRNW